MAEDIKYEHYVICDEIDSLIDWACDHPKDRREIKKHLWSKLTLLIATVELDNSRKHLKELISSFNNDQ